MLAGHPTPKRMPTLHQPSLIRSHKAITPLATLTRAVTSRESGRRGDFPLMGSALQPGQLRLWLEAAATDGDSEPLHRTGFWCHRWSCTVPSTEKNENESSYRGRGQLAESTRALPHRVPVRSRSPQEIQALGSAGWMWQVSISASSDLWKATPYLSGHSGAEASWNEEGNQYLLRLNVLSAAGFQGRNRSKFLLAERVTHSALDSPTPRSSGRCWLRRQCPRALMTQQGLPAAGLLLASNGLKTLRS